jgi:hypothetical protein
MADEQKTPEDKKIFADNKSEENAKLPEAGARKPISKHEVLSRRPIHAPQKRSRPLIGKRR